jgi:hypothetical protein
MKKNYFKEAKRHIFIKPNSAYENGFIIGWGFKKAYQKCVDKGVLINMLKHLSNIVIKGRKCSYQHLREKKYSCKKKCWVCKINKATYYHHIILLKNGGYNYNWNKIPICPDCHKLIHNWL